MRTSVRSRQPVSSERFSPPPIPKHHPAVTQARASIHNSNHRPVSDTNGVHSSSFSQVPRKEFELPDFLSKEEVLPDMQERRQVKDPRSVDSGHPHNGGVTSGERVHQNVTRSQGSVSSDPQQHQAMYAVRDKPRRSNGSRQTDIVVEAQINRSYPQMNGQPAEQKKSEERSEALLMTREELNRLRKPGRGRGNALSGSQPSLASSADLATPRSDHGFSSKTSSDTDSEKRVRISQQVHMFQVNEDDYDHPDYTLKRKYKKGSRDSGNTPTALTNGNSRLRPGVYTPREKLPPHHALSDSDSMKSTSSHSFTDPLPPGVLKNKFSPSVRDHTQLLKDLNLRDRAPNNGYYSASRDSLSGPEEMEPSLPHRYSDWDTSMGYVDSSIEEGNKKVTCKRKNSLQAQLRSRIRHMEISNQDYQRPRYDSDSTTVSDPSVFDDTPLFTVARRAGARMQSLNDLPDDILLRIFSFLSNMELCNASGVCQKWQELCWDPLLWESIEILNYQDSDINKVLRNLLTKLARSTDGRYCLMVRSLKLNGCELLADKGLGFVARYCIDLEELQISNCCCVTGKGLQDILRNCQSLRFLDASGVSCITSIGAPTTNGFAGNDYGSFLQLRHLDISDCVAFDDLGLRHVALSCGLLENLYLRRCNRVSDVGVKHVASRCPHLREVSLSDCLKVRDFSLRELAKNAANLKYLSVAKCPITDSGIKQIGKHCARLKYLNLRGCEGVTDISISHVAQNCLKLRSFDAGKCNITDSGLHTIGVHCPQLRKLSIKGCDQVSDAGVQSIAAQCCSLQYLNVQECNLGYETFVFIREHCKNCIIEHTCPAFF